MRAVWLKTQATKGGSPSFCGFRRPAARFFFFACTWETKKVQTTFNPHRGKQSDHLQTTYSAIFAGLSGKAILSNPIIEKCFTDYSH
ncbi:MAG: hypothetical protein HY842_03490 [Bacteroidetes bacterium]|nr:hypothetical protein [Bacteroidota bacterium]